MQLTSFNPDELSETQLEELRRGLVSMAAYCAIRKDALQYQRRTESSTIGNNEQAQLDLQYARIPEWLRWRD